VPILARTPRQAVTLFRDHLAKLVAGTVTARHPVHQAEGRDGTWVVEFRQGELPATVPLKTRYGTLHFFMGQVLEAVPDGNQYRLQTREYGYRLQNKPGWQEPAVFRWEYIREPAAPYCRHHLHADTAVELGDQSVRLEDIHVPTGWVTVEEVIRFLVYELGLKPPCGERWTKVLADSESRFYEEFTSKRYKPKAAAKPRR
jgi:hypothetical protein